MNDYQDDADDADDADDEKLERWADENWDKVEAAYHRRLERIAESLEY